MQTKILPQDFFAREKGAILIIFKLFFGECRHFISHCSFIFPLCIALNVVFENIIIYHLRDNFFGYVFRRKRLRKLI